MSRNFINVSAMFKILSRKLVAVIVESNHEEFIPNFKVIVLNKLEAVENDDLMGILYGMEDISP